ncbi:NlpC/P60 family protein [Arthrobacter subterraneus]|uniref:NlpC/P60 family protein n=1 Tax=Arthrobacter subterraneus TaxID=335973 RepID=A0A1G8P1F0_9MICC|nr:NlpC/P60 family protein [Arthrobacter subterraneus]SDI86046.1 NlpC/P60 family protein [Arthrobacter subterraneus]
MSTWHAPARHRAVPAQTNTLVVISKAVSSNMGSAGRQAAVITAASGLVLSAGLPAQAVDAPQRQVSTSSLVTTVETEPVSADTSADISFEREAVTAAPAPVVAAPAPVLEHPAPEAEPSPVTVQAVETAPVQQAPAVQEVALQAAAALPAAPAPAPAPKPAPAPAASSSVGAALVASAYAQIGRTQDCTILVEVALRSIGKSVGDLGPEQFYQYGTVVGSPAPGDLVIRPGHIAIYVGNGQVISSGMNGVNDTLLHPLSDLAGSSFVRVNG